VTLLKLISLRYALSLVDSAIALASPNELVATPSRAESSAMSLVRLLLSIGVLLVGVRRGTSATSSLFAVAVGVEKILLSIPSRSGRNCCLALYRNNRCGYKKSHICAGDPNNLLEVFPESCRGQ
jgi:hypothetical protein